MMPIFRAVLLVFLFVFFVLLFFVLFGRVPGLATYTRLRVDWKDRTMLSLLHESGNISYYKIRRQNNTIPLLCESGNEGHGVKNK